MSSKSVKERGTLSCHVRTIHRQYQMEPKLNSKVPSPTNPIDDITFHYHRPKSNMISGAMMEKSRAEYHDQINAKYNIKANVDRIRRLAVRNNVIAIFEAGDDDQIALALMHTLKHPTVKP